MSFLVDFAEDVVYCVTKLSMAGPRSGRPNQRRKRHVKSYEIVMSQSRDSSKIFSERLRIARERAGLSQSDLAEKAGFQASAISHFETGRRSPSFENLRRLSDALGVTTDYLIGRVSEVAASNTLAEALFREYSQMSAADQEFFEQMARTLADRNRPKEG